MKPDVKNSLEYAVITVLVAGLCLWQLISSTQEGEPPPAKLVMLALGLAISTAMHCVFMMQLVRRTGRAFWPWFIGIVVFMPLGTAVLLAVLLSEPQSPDS
ncbi:hypothetical protein DBR42_27820 [Pelomonas sp. HMWF004]|nr:hypothetical protein DBR42_27820 [Pelomonas sp. HMWF004]